MEKLKLYESEYRFMDLIWETEPVRSTDLARLARIQMEWKKSTSYTVLKKLAEKGFVQNDNALVTSLVDREQVQKYESESLIEKNFGGSLPAFLNAFLKDRKLSRQEADAIHRMIEDAIPEEDISTGGEEEGRA